MPASISLDDAAAARAWFAEVVEPLADSFEARDVARYVALFSEVLASLNPACRPRELAARFERVRHTRRFSGPDPDPVFVLSRVTLGADVAVTSVLLDAAKRRFPNASIRYVGPTKGYELFAGDARIQHVAAPYDRGGSIRDRVTASQSLERLLNQERSIVIDPDSRLTQLGLVAVCPEPRYFLFETRSLDGPGSVSDLASRWTAAVFGVAGAPFVSPVPKDFEACDVVVSLGVGENPSKRVVDPFERLLMERVSASGRCVLVDQGAGGEESVRARRATLGLPGIELFEGPFASFAARIARGKRYIGYDSAGQHVAAAAGVPLVAVFAGYPNRRFLERWRPTGPGPVTVIEAERHDPSALVEKVFAALNTS